METIIVEIMVPACNAIYDFMLPTGINVETVIKEMVRILVSTGLTVDLEAENAQLCDIDQASVLDPSRTLAGQGVCDGVRLMLV